MNGQFLFWTPHTISTPHIQPFYCSIFEIWTLFDLEEYKDTISNKYKKWMVSSYMGRPMLYAHLYETILLQRFWDMEHYSI